MQKFTGLLFLMALSLNMMAAQVTIIVTSIPQNTPSGDNIYIAGNFNGWNPGDPAYMLAENGQGFPQIILTGTGGIEFKFTRGSWETVEGNENGQYLPNRTFTFGAADTLELQILSWEDQGGGNHTAAENVVIMDEDFLMPQFNRTRRIWLYLPPDYETSGKNYPVLYMHDGQNLFDAATSFAGEWEVDETLNEMFAAGKEVPIVVGIDNGGGYRIDEYTPWPNPNYGGGDGELYAQFIVETLKPYIDDNYRTKPEQPFTGVMGSSLGGLISHYIADKYQEIFSKAGVFSPSYWFNDSVYDFTYLTGKQQPVKFYIMGGTAESGSLVQEMNDMADTLKAVGFTENEISVKAVQGGQHNEQLWRQEFGEAYEWLFLGSTAAIAENTSAMPVKVIISGRKLSLRCTGQKHPCDRYFVNIFSVNGQEIFQTSMASDSSINLPQIAAGQCIVKLSCENFSQSVKLLIGVD